MLTNMSARVLILATGAVCCSAVSFSSVIAGARPAVTGHNPFTVVGEKMPDPLPSQAEALRLHQRLLARDSVATSELAEAYLQPLIDWLAQAGPRAPKDSRVTAAEDAVVALIKKPESYDPTRGELFPYLRDEADARTEQLLRRAFEQAGMPPELVRTASLEWRHVGFRPGVDLATRNQHPQPIQMPRYHVRVRWPAPVRGLLFVGAARYRGLGIFAIEER
jgi:hypothetical protein